MTWLAEVFYEFGLSAKVLHYFVIDRRIGPLIFSVVVVMLLGRFWSSSKGKIGQDMVNYMVYIKMLEREFKNRGVNFRAIESSSIKEIKARISRCVTRKYHNGYSFLHSISPSKHLEEFVTAHNTYIKNKVQ